VTRKARALEALLALALLGIAGVGVKQCAARREREERAAEERALQALPGPPRPETAASAPAPETTPPPARAEAPPAPATPSAPAATTPAHLATSGGHLLGDLHARVRIVEFADYLCPHCRNMVPTVRALLAANPGRVAVVYRNFPIFGQRSYDVITAAECAARQGRFTQAFDALAGPTVLARPDWQLALARAARVPDHAAYTRCIAGSEVHDLIQRDIAAAQANGVTGTPTFIIDGRLYDGEYALETLHAAVQQALEHAH